MIAAFPRISDPVAAVPNEPTAWERFWLRLLNDPRDLPLVRLLTWIHVTVLPVGVLLFLPILDGVAWWLAYAAWFWVAQMRLRGPFCMLLHNVNHRRLFRPAWHALNVWVIWAVCPFFGHTPETYFAHHVGMHHVEDNQPGDDSSTLAYRRDSGRDLARYVLRFVFFGFFTTFRYLYSRGRTRFYRRFACGELSALLAVLGLLWVAPGATLAVFVVPLLLGRLVMMIGNWTQHAFADPRDPANPYRNTYVCINTPYNAACWNDGYHLVHHLHPGAHYSDMPMLLARHWTKVCEEAGLVFDRIHYGHVCWYLMTRRYDLLARHLVVTHEVLASPERAAAVLRERTMPPLREGACASTC